MTQFGCFLRGLTRAACLAPLCALALACGDKDTPAGPGGPGSGVNQSPNDPGSNEPGTGSNEPGTGSNEPGTGSNEPGTGSNEPGGDPGGAGTGSDGPGEQPGGDGDGDGDSPGEPAAPGADEWTMIGYDLGSTYNNTAETRLTRENAAQLEEAYTVDMGGNVYGAPLMVGDRIYASGPANVRALEAETGDELWTAPVGSTASLAYADGRLYVHTRGAVVALDANSGDELWRRQPDSTQAGDGSSSPIVVGDLVVVGGSNGGAELTTGAFRGYLAALDRVSGAVRWVTHTVPTTARGASIWSTIAADLAAGRIYGSTGNNYGGAATDTSDAIIAFNLEGDIQWKNQRTEGDNFGARFSGMPGSGPDYDFGANPVLYEAMVEGELTQLVSAGAKSGTAHAFRRDTGDLVWERSLGGGSANGSTGIFVNSTWSGRVMIFAHNAGTTATLYGLDGGTGDIEWQRPLPGLVWGRISVANGVGFVGAGTTLEVFDTDTGAVLKSIQSKGGTVAGTIAVANGRVAFGEGLSWASGARGTILTVLELP